MTPRIVKILCAHHEGWIVGGAAFQDDPKDWDVVVPHSQWREASSLIPLDARPNSFGGWKFEEDGISIDVWPGDLSWLLNCARVKAVWNPSNNIRFTRS